MCHCRRCVPDEAVWNKELLLGAVTVAWGQEQGVWRPVLFPDAGLTGQDGMDSLRPVNFSGCSPCTTASLLCSQPWHIVVLAPLAHPRPGLCPGVWGCC